MAWLLLIPIGWFFTIKEVLRLESIAGPYDMIKPFPWGFFGWAAAIFFFVMITVVAVMVCFGIGSMFGSMFNGMKIWKFKEIESEPLISIRDKDGDIQGSISGGMFIFSGQVNSSPYYFYYTKNEDGSYQPGKVRADSSVRIFEEDTDSPRLVTKQTETDRWWVEVFGLCDTATRYEIHVPKGTVRREMSV